MANTGKYYGLDMINSLDPILKNERGQETAGRPTHYYKVGRSIVLYPTVDISQVTASEGLRITYDRKMDLFVVGDTTQEPGFDELLHPICYYAPSWEWAMTKGVAGVAQMCERNLGQWPGLREVFAKFFSMRDKNDVSKISRLRKTYR